MNKLISPNGVVLDWNPALGRYVEDKSSGHRFGQQEIIHIIPYGNEFLAVTISGTLCKTNYNGTAWERIDLPEEEYEIESIFITNAGTWLLGVQEISTANRCGVLRSTNEGQTWSFHSAPCVTGYANQTIIKQFAQAPSGQIIAVGGSRRSTTNAWGDGQSYGHAWSSTSDGTSWTRFVTNAGIHSLMHVVWDGFYFYIPTFVTFGAVVYGVGSTWDQYLDVGVSYVSGRGSVFFNGRFVFFGTLNICRLITTTDFTFFSTYTLTNPYSNTALRCAYFHNNKLRVIDSNGHIYEITDWSSSETYVGHCGQPIYLCAQVGTNLVLVHSQAQSINYGITYQSSNGGLTLNQISWANIFQPLVYFQNHWVYFPDLSRSSGEAPVPKEGVKRIAYVDKIGDAPTYIDIPEPYNFFTSGFHDMVIADNGNLLIVPVHSASYPTGDPYYPPYIVELETLDPPTWHYAPILYGLNFRSNSAPFVSFANYRYLVDGFAVADDGRFFFINCEWFFDPSLPNYLLDHPHYVGFYSEGTTSRQVYLEDTFENYTRDVLSLNPFRGAVFHNSKFYVLSGKGYNTYCSLWESADGINFTGHSLTELGSSFNITKGSSFLFSGIACLCIANGGKIYSMPDGMDEFSEVGTYEGTMRRVAKQGNVYIASISNVLSGFVNFYRMRVFDGAWNIIGSYTYSDNNSPLGTDKHPQYVVGKDGLVLIQSVSGGAIVHKKTTGINYAIITTTEPVGYPLSGSGSYRSMWLGTYMKLGDLCRVRAVTADNWINTEILFESLNETSYEWEIDETINSNLPFHSVGGVFCYVESTGILYSWGGGTAPWSWKIDTNNYTIEPGPNLRWGTIYYISDAGMNIWRYGPRNNYARNIGNREIFYSSGHRVGKIDDVRYNQNVYFPSRDQETRRYAIWFSFSVIYLTAADSLDANLYTSIAIPPEHQIVNTSGNSQGIRSFDGTLLTDWNSDELGTERGIAYSLDNGITWNHVALPYLVYYNPLFGLDSNTLLNAVIGGGKHFIISNRDLHYSTDLINWQRYRFTVRLTGCMDFIDDEEFLSLTPAKANNLVFWAGSHLLRSYVWEKRSEFYLGFLTQMDPPIEVDSPSYQRKLIPTGNEFWSSDFINQQRHEFPAFGADVVGWALYYGGFLIHKQEFPALLEILSTNPGPVIQIGGLTFTFD